MGNTPTEVVYEQWVRSPARLFVPEATYFLTAATCGKEKYFHTAERLSFLLNELMVQAEVFGWQLQAWAVMQNHYHFVAVAMENPASLEQMIQELHSLTAEAVNAEDNTDGRGVWCKYEHACLRNEKSYLARLHFVHTNPVKHGLISAAEDYRWCSMRWFLSKADSRLRQTVLSSPCDRISVDADF
ncbi:transposase [Candidatus Sumerlaeota bacterium]|nr:transposase [Candidatus Sumerlaeota bacterium]